MKFMRMGHILIISFSTWPSNSKQGRILGNIIKALGPRFDADVLTIRESDMGYIEKVNRTRLLRVPVGEQYSQQVEAFQRAISRQLDSDEYDIIHFRSPWAGNVIAQKLQYFDSKIIYEPALGRNLMADATMSTRLEEMEQISIDLADLIIVASTYQATYLKEKLGVTKPIHIIAPGVDVDQFDWDVTTGLTRMDLIWVDNFNDLSITDFVFNSLSRIIKTKPDFRAGLVGSVNHEIASELMKQVEKAGLIDAIKFFGPQDIEALPLLMSRAKMGLVSPHINYNTLIPRFDCMNILEYMSCRTVTIAPSNPFTTEITQNGSLAYLYNSALPDSLTYCIESILSDPEKAAETARTAYYTTRNRYTASEMRRRMLYAYAELLPPISIEDGLLSQADDRPHTISWQGKKTSSTGPGSHVPTVLTEGQSDVNEISLDIDDIEFEASGVLLGMDVEKHDEETDPFQPVRY